MSDFFSPGQAKLIANFLLGGAGVGVAGAGLVSLAQDIKDKVRDANPETGGDDDVVYVDVPAKPQPKLAAPKPPLLKAAGLMGGLATPGVALAGGTIAGIEAYRALRRGDLAPARALLVEGLGVSEANADAALKRLPRL